MSYDGSVSCLRCRAATWPECLRDRYSEPRCRSTIDRECDADADEGKYDCGLGLADVYVSQPMSYSTGGRASLAAELVLDTDDFGVISQ